MSRSVSAVSRSVRSAQCTPYCHSVCSVNTCCLSTVLLAGERAQQLTSKRGHTGICCGGVHIGLRLFGNDTHYDRGCSAVACGTLAWPKTTPDMYRHGETGGPHTNP